MTALIVVGMLSLFAALSFAGWRIHRREPHEQLRRVMKSMTREMQQLSKTIGDALIPAVKSAAMHMEELADAVSRAMYGGAK